MEGIAPETAILDASGTIVYVNSAWVRYAIENGSSDPKACIGRNYIDVCLQPTCPGGPLTQDGADGIKAVIAGTLSDFGKKYPCHSRMQERWFFMTVTRASTGGDIVIVHNDVTQLVQAERGNAEAERLLLLAHERFESSRALAESEERFKKIVDAAFDAVVIIDGEGRIHSLNPAAERIFGFNRGEAVGGNVSLLMAEPHHMFQESPVSDRIEDGTARGVRKVEGQRRDGSKFPVKLCVTAWSVAGKRYFAGIMRDITEFQCNS